MQKPPVAKKTNFSYKMHGETIHDPYQWLEDRDNQEVKDWANSQNTYVKNTFEDSRYREITKELKKNWDFTWQSAPLLNNKYWYYSKRKPDENQARLMRRTVVNKKEECILDPNKFEKNQSLNGARYSRDYSKLAYMITINGSEENTVFVVNVNTGKLLRDKLDVSRGGNVVWHPDNSGFFYSMPDPKLNTKEEPYYYMRIFFHTLGQLQSEDKQIFGEDFEKEYSFGYTISPDGKYLAIGARKGWKEEQLFLYNLETKKSTELMSELVGLKRPYANDNYLFVYTNCDAPNFRVLRFDLESVSSNPGDFLEILPEKKDHKLEYIGVIAGGIVAEYIKDVASIGQVFDYSGELIFNLDIPKLSSITEIACDRKCEDFSFSYTNLLQSRTIVLANSQSKSMTVFQKPQFKLGKNFCAEQRWYRSADRTRVPMFIVRRKELPLNSKNPTVLYSYGGYGKVLPPIYPTLWTDFIKSGGIYVIANIRGGGEFGANWHKAGTGKKKKRAFEDIIAAAEFLESEKYTSPKHLAIVGGSNGGMSVLACMILKPQIFGAIVAKVPLSDMYKFHKFLIASRWTEEKGDPDNKEDFYRIKTWSPLHNLRKEISYPPVLMRAGQNDSRVHPMHAWKMAARMQEYGNHQVYMFTDFTAGHVRVDKKQSLEDQALTLRFLEETIY